MVKTELKAHRVYKVLLELMVKTELTVLRVHKAYRVLLEQTVLRVHKVLPALLVLLGQTEIRIGLIQGVTLATVRIRCGLIITQKLLAMPLFKGC